MRQIKVDLVLAADTVALETDLKDLTRGNIARNQIAVCRILFFEKVPTLTIWNVLWSSCVGRISRDPDTSAFAAS